MSQKQLNNFVVLPFKKELLKNIKAYSIINNFTF